MRNKTYLLGALAALIAMPVLAQAADDAVRVVGKVEKMDGKTLVAKSIQGKTETFALNPIMTVFYNKKATLKDIKAGDFVASTAVKGTDGKLHSIDMRILPEALRGVGEGQRAVNEKQTMTNATVSGVAMVGENGTVKVKLPNMESELIVEPGTPVTAVVAGDKEMVKVGAGVLISGSKNPDGSQTAEWLILQ